MDAGIAVVEEVLGGQVISDTARPELGDEKEAMPTPVEEELQVPTKADDELPAVHGKAGKDTIMAEQTGAETEQAEADPEQDDVVEEQPEPQPEPEPAAPAPTGDGQATVVCGSPRFPDAACAEGIGCGQGLTVTLQEGRVVAVDGPDTPELVEIAGLRERAFLHNTCYAAVRKARVAAR